jgi:tetratricopeptide (TPR) repeat protein
MSETVYENQESLYLASLVSGDNKKASEILLGLHKKFPGSNRVKKLIAYAKETSEDSADVEEAVKIYEELIKKFPDDPFPRKRLSLLVKDKLGFLNGQLDDFQGDSEIHQELAMQYIRTPNNPSSILKAIFHFEEVLLAHPNSVYAFTVYAELLFTAGRTNDNGGYKEMAQKYFCYALRHEPGNLRALWGLYECLIGRTGESSGKKKSMSSSPSSLSATERELLEMTKSKLSLKYPDLSL